MNDKTQAVEAAAEAAAVATDAAITNVEKQATADVVAAIETGAEQVEAAQAAAADIARAAIETTHGQEIGALKNEVSECRQMVTSMGQEIKTLAETQGTLAQILDRITQPVSQSIPQNSQEPEPPPPPEPPVVKSESGEGHREEEHHETRRRKIRL